MPDFNFTQVISDAIALTKNELGNTFKKVKPFAEHESNSFLRMRFF